MNLTRRGKPKWVFPFRRSPPSADRSSLFQCASGHEINSAPRRTTLSKERKLKDYMRLKALSELRLNKKTVLVRTGFDITTRGSEIEDDYRVADAIPTLQHLIKSHCKIIVISHRGRPEGADQKYSLEPAARRLAELLERKFVVIETDQKKLPEYSVPHLYFFKHSPDSDALAELLASLREGDIAVLENLRFVAGEQKADIAFAKKLASYAEAYVNEAFSVSHRAQASVALLPKLLPSAAGLSLQKEIAALQNVLLRPKKPVVVMMGGIKLSDKAEALQNLLKFADYALLGGGLANVFLKVRGFEVGKSVFAEDGSEERLAKQMWRDYREKIILPIDVIVSRSREGEPECLKIEQVKPEHIILDIGPQTIRLFSGYLKKGLTLVWGGPLGYFENKTYSHGTFALAWLFAARSANPKIFGVAGGGQTLEVIKKLNLRQDIDCVSTGGGAMLDFLAGKTLPGLEALQK